MGKIRTKLIDDSEDKKTTTPKKVKSGKGKTRGLVDMSSEDQRSKIKDQKEQTDATPEKIERVNNLAVKHKEKTSPDKLPRSKKYQHVKQLVDRNKIYSLLEALELLRKVNIGKFNATVELHLNLTEKGIRGQIVLPYGTGKKTRVEIADDKTLEKLDKGKIDFDVLVASPEMMPKLAKYAKILGPKGLMPNPKNGTISENPETLAEKFAGGQVSYKTESEFPLMHLVVGKLDFSDKNLEENIKAYIYSIGVDKVKKAVLKSTMSPGIRIEI